MVDAAVAEHFEVLQVVRFGRLRSPKLERHADAFERRLRDAVDHRGLGQPGDVQNRLRDVDDVVELTARSPPLPSKPFGQWTIVPLRVPPQCEATCFVHW